MKGLKLFLTLALVVGMAVTVVGCRCKGIHVETYPPGAAISLNGDDVKQKTPYCIKGLLTGEYEVEVFLEGYERVKKTVMYKEGEEVELEWILPKGWIDVDTDPSGATIFLNGKELEGKSSYRITGLMPGTYEVEVFLEGYHNKKEVVVYEQGKKTDLEFVLVKKGWIYIKSNPSGAAIRLNGRSLDAKTPHYIRGLETGRYKIELCLESYQEETLTIDFARSDELEKTIILKPEKKNGNNAGNGNGVESKAEEFEGAALIKGGDVDRAKTDAINNALMAAIEYKYGPLAAEKERLSNFALYRGRLISDPRIRKYSVVKAWQDGGMCLVKVAVKFVAPPGPLKIRIDVKERYVDIKGKNVDSSFFVNKLKQLLIKHLKVRIVTGQLPDEPVDLVLTGSATSKEHSHQGSEYIYRADANVTLVWAISGEPLDMPEAHVVGHAGHGDGADAARSALSKAAEKVAKKIIDATMEFKKDILERYVIISNVAEVQKANDIIRRIKDIEGVTMVEQYSYDEKTRMLYLLVRMKIGEKQTFEYYLGHLKRVIDLNVESSRRGVIHATVD